MPIADHDTYVTDPGRPRSIFSKIFLGPKVTFYPQVIRIVTRSGRMASKGLYGDREWVDSSFEVMRALENVGIRFEITGMDHIRNSKGPVVFIGNHMSTLETLVLPCIIQPVKPVTFVVKDSLLTMPVFGHVMRSRNPVVVGRANAREDLKTVLEKGAEKIMSGKSMIIFPQSTRALVFKPEEFNTLGIKLAIRAGVPVVPFALKTDAWGVGRLIKEFGPVDRRKTVHFAFGGPMLPGGRGVAEHARVVDFIREKLELWERNEHRQ